MYGDADKEGFKRQFPKNLFANIANFIVSIAIGIFLVPYFIDTLGIAAYGLIPLATSFTSYVTILTDSLNVAVSRYLIFDLHQQDYKKANRTFNTALIGLSGIILVLIPCVVVLSYYAPRFFNVPAGQEFEVILLFLGVLAAFLIRSWSSNFTVSLFAYNRLDLQNLLYVISIIVQVSLIVGLFTVFSPQLGYIGLAYLVSSIIYLIGAVILSKRINPHVHLDIRQFDRSRLKELSLIAWWAVTDQVGSLLLLQFDLIVVNLLFGATMAGEYAVIFLWVTLLRGIGGTLSGALSPMILTYFAQGRVDQIIRAGKKCSERIWFAYCTSYRSYMRICTSDPDALGRSGVYFPFTSHVGAYPAHGNQFMHPPPFCDKCRLQQGQDSRHCYPGFWNRLRFPGVLSPPVARLGVLRRRDRRCDYSDDEKRVLRTLVCNKNNGHPLPFFYPVPDPRSMCDRDCRGTDNPCRKIIYYFIVADPGIILRDYFPRLSGDHLADCLKSVRTGAGYFLSSGKNAECVNLVYQFSNQKDTPGELSLYGSISFLTLWLRNIFPPFTRNPGDTGKYFQRTVNSL